MKLPEEKSRYEFKYVFKKRYLSLLLSYLKKIGLEKDKNLRDEKYYTVTSLYFDTSFLRDYFEKQYGIKSRRKYRIRTYAVDFSDNYTNGWLEIKYKHDMHIIKKRISISKENLKMFLEKGILNRENKDKFDDFDYDLFLYNFRIHNYKPKVVVRYKRIAYIGHFLSKIRMTFDYDIEAGNWRSFAQNGKLNLIENDNVVVEIKFMYAMPWWFKDMIIRFQFARTTFSKYAGAINFINKHHPIPR